MQGGAKQTSRMMRRWWFPAAQLAGTGVLLQTTGCVYDPAIVQYQLLLLVRTLVIEAFAYALGD